MRCVTTNPPKTLILARIVAKYPIINEGSSVVSIVLSEFDIIKVKLPTIIIPEIALVTLIKGVCRAGVTAQTTKYPTNIARVNTIKLIIKDKNKITHHNYLRPTSGMLLVEEVSDDLDGR